MSELNFAPIAYSLELSLISSALSIMLALPIAVIAALNEKERIVKISLTIFSISAFTPSIIVTQGIREVLLWLPFAQPIVNNYFDKSGYIINYIYYNLALSIIVLYLGLIQTPDYQKRLASSLNLNFVNHFRYIFLPRLKKVLPLLVLLTLYFCLSDFNISYILGSSPSRTTLSISIYQGLLFWGDQSASNLLAIAQFLPLVLITIILIFWRGLPDFLLTSGSVSADESTTKLSILAKLVFTILIIVFSAPWCYLLIESVWQFISTDLMPSLRNQALWQAFGNSAGLAFFSGFLASSLGYLYLFISAKNTSYIWKLLPLTIFFIPQTTAAYFIFKLLLAFNSLELLQNFMVYVLLYSLLFFAIAVFILGPSFNAKRKNFAAIIKTLNLNPWQIFLYVDLAELKTVFSLSFALCACLTLSDLTLLSLFSAPLNTLTTLQNNLWQTYNLSLLPSVRLFYFLLIFMIFLPYLISNWNKQKNVRT